MYSVGALRAVEAYPAARLIEVVYNSLIRPLANEKRLLGAFVRKFHALHSITVVVNRATNWLLLDWSWLVAARAKFRRASRI